MPERNEQGLINFAEEIEEAAGGEPIECIVIGSTDSWGDVQEIRPDFAKALDPGNLWIPMSWAHARPMLDCFYDDGFGGADCPPIYAWTASRVITVHEYDGSTTVGWVPRHPAEGLRPTFV